MFFRSKFFSVINIRSLLFHLFVEGMYFLSLFVISKRAGMEMKTSCSFYMFDLWGRERGMLRCFGDNSLM